MRVCFVTTLCPHYRIKTFETLARCYEVDYYFFSAGDEWYWEKKRGLYGGHFHCKCLWGFRLARTRVTPTLATALWRVNYDVFIKCINGRFALPITYFISRLRRKPFILWTGIWMTLRTPFHRLIFPITYYLYHHASAIVVYGKHVERYLVGLGINPEKIFIAPHAVDNDFYAQPVSDVKKVAVRQRLSILPRQKVVLYVGRLEASKGLSYLVEAFSMLKCNDKMLVLVGDGSQRTVLQAMMQEHHLDDKMRFLGYVSPKQTLSYYALSEVFVLPSITMPTGKEPWGLVVNEAMNQGLPVVATNAVGAAVGGLVQNGISGFVVPERDSVVLAEAIDRILNNPTLGEQMRQNACRIITKWNNERMVLGFRRAVEYVMEKYEK